MAYQGFGHGIAEDGAVIGKFVAAGSNIFVSTSFSKSFSLYGERVGALSVVASDKDEAARVLSQLQDRDPHQLLQPAHPRRRGGGRRARQPRAARAVEKELGEMRVRIKDMRQTLVDGLESRRRASRDMSFITTQNRHVQLLGPEQGANGAPAHPSWRVRHRHRPHVRGRAQQQKQSITFAARLRKSFKRSGSHALHTSRLFIRRLFCVLIVR